MVRKIVSLTSFLSLAVTLVTSVVLYVVPHGRVAYWADWTLLGLSKDQWGAIHITVGTLFVVALLLHLWLNWKSLTAYMRDARRRMVVMTLPMMVSVLITLFVAAGTLYDVPPMRQLLALSASIKDAATETYGNPPYGHAEQSPLRKFCGYLGIDVEDALAALYAAGYDPAISADTEVRDIARSRGVSPQQVFNDIHAALGGDPFAMLPPGPPEGTGRMTLESLCAAYGLPLDQVMARLGAKSIHARPDMTMRDIAQENSVAPRDVYNALRGE
jgi:hypothetical protein